MKQEQKPCEDVKTPVAIRFSVSTFKQFFSKMFLFCKIMFSTIFGIGRPVDSKSGAHLFVVVKLEHLKKNVFEC